jgi:hypothetical protein
MVGKAERNCPKPYKECDAPMLVNELEVIVYPECGPWRSEISGNPTWRQIEKAIRQLDRHAHPFLFLFLPPAKLQTDLRSLNIMGGLGEYGISAFDSKHHQLQYYCDPSRPDGPDRVEIWASDQGAEYTERYLCNNLASVLRIAKHFAKMGALDPSVSWADWPPAKLFGDDL